MARVANNLPLGQSLFQNVECTKYVIQGHKACSVISTETDTLSGVPLAIMTVSSYFDGQMYIFLMSGTEDSFDHYLPTFEKMLASFNVPSSSGANLQPSNSTTTSLSSGINIPAREQPQANTSSAAAGQPNLVIPPSSRSTYRDSIGDLHIVGEVQNNFTFPINFVQLTATLYDSSHQVVSTGNTYSDLDLLVPGAKSGFDVLVTNAPQNVNGYALSASYQQAYISKPATLAINVGRSNLDVINAYHLLGEVTNQGNNTATFVKVSAVFFDVNHKVMDAVYTYTSPSDLQPGQKAPFDLQSLSPNTRQIKFASINVQSNEYSLINNQPLISVNSNALLGNGTLASTTPLTNSITSSHNHHNGNTSHHSGSKSSSNHHPSSVIHIPNIHIPNRHFPHIPTFS